MSLAKVLVVLMVLWTSGCTNSSRTAEDGASAGSGAEASEVCGADAPATPAHCQCLGGYVRGDIGDGQITCPPGETQLERVQQGIEGAVCCKRFSK